MKNPFIAFTSKTAMKMFLPCLFAGALTIFINFNPHYLAPCVVLIYSFVLLIAQVRYHIALSQETKNSPYFMGFLLTMLSLLNIFLSIKKVEPETFGSIVIPQIGAAMLTTIVGLVMRHVLTSGSIELSEQEKIYKSATEELQENIVAYKTAQVKLIELINDFISSHKTMGEAIAKASSEHLESLSESTSAIAKLGKQYPPKLHKFLTSLDEILVKLDSFLNNTIPSIDRKISEDLTAKMTALLENFHNFSMSLFKQIGTSLSELQKTITDTSSNYKVTFKELPVVQEKLIIQTEEQLKYYKSRALSFLKESTQYVADEFKKLQTTVLGMSEALSSCNTIIDNGFEKSLGHISERLNVITEAIEKVQKSANAMEQDIDKNNKAISGHVSAFGKEIGEIDRLVDSFIETMKRRLN